MQTSKILQIVRSRWSGVTAFRNEAPEPLDHPSLRGMSSRELADLPLERWEQARPCQPLEAAAGEKGAPPRG